MANAITAFTPAYWSKRMQVIHEKKTVYRAIASFEERAVLRDGDTVHRPYRSALVAQNYTKATAVTIQDLTATDETLVVNTAKIVPFYVDDIDKIQNRWDTVNRFADDAQIKLNQQLDGECLSSMYQNATSKIDDADFAGTSGNGHTFDVTDIFKMFTKAGRKMTALNIDEDDRAAVISPHIRELLVEYLGGKESSLGDKTNMNGHIGQFMGFMLYLSNNLAFSARLEMGTNPTNGDTVTVNGVVWTFKTTPATAGEVDIGATAAASVTLLVSAINGTGTQDTATTYYEVSAANRNKLREIAATDNTTNMTIIHKGGSFQSSTDLTETLTAAADIWTANKKIQHQVFCKKGSIDVVVQKEPTVEFRMVQDKLGRNVLPWIMWGIKVFNEQKGMIVDVQARADAF